MRFFPVAARLPLRSISAVASLLIACALVVVAGALFISWIGVYNVAATSGHSAPLGWFLHFTMKNSVKEHAPRLRIPPLSDPDLITAGQIYAAHRCSPCHEDQTHAADVSATELLPRPPPLNKLAQDFDADEIHWIIKNGVKMSAMPAWPAQSRDDDVWPLVAYLTELKQKQPATTADQKVANRSGLGGSVTINTCFDCHGSDGNGKEGVFPKLAGLSDEYIQSSLRAYRSGERPSGFMQPFAHQLSNADIANFASYFSGLSRKPSAHSKTDEMLVKQGSRIADPTKNTRSTAACLTCHTRSNPKPYADIPDLAGQPQAYLETQLKLFRNRTRSSTANSDIMVRIAKHYSDEDIEAVSAYFASLVPGGNS